MAKPATSHTVTSSADIVSKFAERVLARIPGAELITAANLPGKVGREVYLPQASVAQWRVESTRVGLDGRICVSLTMTAPRRSGRSGMSLDPAAPVILLASN